MTPNFGLPQRSIDELHAVFARHNKVHKVVIYGSRAMGNYKQGSDIDLTLFGEGLEHQDLLNISSDLDDSNIPYLVDLSIFDWLDHVKLKAHINREGKVFYDRCADWKTVKLGDVCNVKRGTTITRKVTAEGNVPVIGGGTKPTYFHNQPNRDANCITISGSGASAGYVNMWDVAIFASDCSTVEPKDDTQLHKFIYYYLSSQQEYIYKNFRSGAAQPHVYGKDIATLQFPILTLAEQQRIVAKLDAAFAEIDMAIDAAETKESEVAKLKSTLLAASLDSESTDIVMRKTKNLSDVIEKGETINPTNNPNAYFSYIDVSSVDRSSFHISKTQTLLGQDAPSRARRAVRKGDVIFATIRPTLKRIAIVPEELDGEVCSTGYIVLRPKASEICSKYIFYFMLSDKVKAEMEGLQTGASYPAVNDSQVKAIHISYPPLKEQQRIVAMLDNAFNEANKFDYLMKKIRANFQFLKSAILAKELQNEAA